MLRTPRRLILLSLIVAGVAAFLFSPGVAQAQDAARRAPALVGTWRVIFDRPPGPPGTALVTFTSDGTSVRTTDRSPVMSASHGAWMQVNEREFQATWHAFQFDEKGVHIGNQQASFRVTFGSDLNRFTGMAKGTAHALDGTLKGTVAGPFQGTRVVVEPYTD
ncbi:MAG: hypothetical protein JWM77_2463 [Rhodospirillales bacterium]|jgi:hypothetical protein|nr:hypothetical protein [Rhodospirillales bacterium]